MVEAMTVKVDVAVVGAGGAGLVAAAVAQEAGAKVALLSKSVLGLNNCTTYAGGGFTFGVEPVLGAGQGLSIEDHEAVTRRAGRGLNDGDLLRTLCSEAALTVKSLERFGVRAQWRKSGCSVTPFSRSRLQGGTGMTLPLADHLRRTDAVIIEDFFATAPLFAGGDGTGGGEVAGVRGVRLQSGQPVEVQAAALIVATGGGGRIYSRTDNPIHTTGDGYRLLFAAGVPMQDMEFVQFYPISLAEPGSVPYLIDLGCIDVAPLRNSEGRDFLREEVLDPMELEDGRQANLHARDRCTVAIARQWHAGNEVFLHLERAEAGQRRDDLLKWLKPFLPKGYTVADGPVRIRPTQHYFCGGAVIDEHGWTGVPGLYACGESTGGVDGANRVGGNALSNITVFGTRAGRAAAAYAAKVRSGTPNAPEAGGAAGAAGDTGTENSPAEWPELAQIQRWRDNAAGAGTGSGGKVQPAELKAALNKVCDRYLGPVRNAANLRQAYGEITALVASLPDLAVASWQDLMAALEAENLVFVARMVARAALEREESRGAHFREEFPEERADWARHVILRPRAQQVQQAQSTHQSQQVPRQTVLPADAEFEVETRPVRP